jgi:hypothetical protein
LDISRFHSLRNLARTAAKRGGRVSKDAHVFLLPGRPYCDDPKPFGGHVTSKQLYNLPPVASTAFDAWGLAPCRRCAKCLQFKQMHWRERALVEIERAPRTWFVTLTFSPMQLAQILMRQHHEKGRAEKQLEKSAYRHVQRYLKRLRKNNRFRYLAVFERGEKTGRPHFHMLLHEVDRPVTKRQIEGQWSSHVHCRLVPKDDLSVELSNGRQTKNVATYVTKYCTKDADTRFRPSAGYGKVS